MSPELDLPVGDSNHNSTWRRNTFHLVEPTHEITRQDLHDFWSKRLNVFFFSKRRATLPATQAAFEFRKLLGNLQLNRTQPELKESLYARATTYDILIDIAQTELSDAITDRQNLEREGNVQAMMEEDGIIFKWASIRRRLKIARTLPWHVTLINQPTNTD